MERFDEGFEGLQGFLAGKEHESKRKEIEISITFSAQPPYRA